MENSDTTRKSHCSACGKRLSVQTAPGNIHWSTCSVNDEGIYCETCAITVAKATRKPAKSKDGKK